MIYRITAHNISSCHIDLPLSKSISNRVLIINALSGRGLDNCRLAMCNDTRTMLQALSSSLPTIDVNDAGTAMRFLTTYCAITPGEHTITGSPRMKQRPIAPLVDTLRELGASVSYCEQEGYPPLRIKGTTLTGGNIAIRGDISSQFITALLLIAPYMTHGLTLNIEGKILSRPYIAMTVELMKYYKIGIEHHNNSIVVKPGKYSHRDYSIPQDWTATSYWYEISYLSNTPYYFNSISDTLQGDSMTAHYFSLLGINTSHHGDTTTIAPQEAVCSEMPAVLRLNLQDNPDIAQTIIAACILKKQYFSISGLDNLHIKETHRINALISEAAKLGAVLTHTQPHTLQWMGESCPITHPIVIDTHSDHRMAMAFAPAAITHREVWIENPLVVEKSYPGYWHDLKKAGFNITTHDGKEVTL